MPVLPRYHSCQRARLSQLPGLSRCGCAKLAVERSPPSCPVGLGCLSTVLHSVQIGLCRMKQARDSSSDACSTTAGADSGGVGGFVCIVSWAMGGSL